MDQNISERGPQKCSNCLILYDYYKKDILDATLCLEVGEEESRLVILHLPMLDGLPSQRVVQFHSLDGGGAPLILPEHAVNVIMVMGTSHARSEQSVFVLARHT